MNEPGIIEDLRWLSEPGGGWDPWAVIALAFAMVLVAGLVWRAFFHGRSGQPFRRVIPPHEKALNALRDLGPLAGEETGLEFVRRVSQVLRIYIHERCGIRAPHLSTEEFLVEAAGNELLGPERRDLLQVFLQQCDRVKFAQVRLSADTLRGLLATAGGFVRETSPLPEEPVR